MRTMHYDEPVLKHGTLKGLKAAFRDVFPKAQFHPWKGRPSKPKKANVDVLTPVQEGILRAISVGGSPLENRKKGEFCAGRAALSVLSRKGLIVIEGSRWILTGAGKEWIAAL